MHDYPLKQRTIGRLLADKAKTERDAQKKHRESASNDPVWDQMEWV